MKKTKGPPSLSTDNFWLDPSVREMSARISFAFSKASHAPPFELDNAMREAVELCRSADLMASSMGLPASPMGRPPYPFLSFNAPAGFDTGVCLNEFERDMMHPVVSAVRHLKRPSGHLVLERMFELGAPHKCVINGRVGGNIAHICARQGLSGALEKIMKEAVSQGADRETLLSTIASWLSGCAESLSHDLAREASPWISRLAPDPLPIDGESVFNSPMVSLLCRDVVGERQTEMACRTLEAFLDLAPLSSWPMEPQDEWPEWVAKKPEPPWLLTVDAICSGSLWAVRTIASRDMGGIPPARDISELMEKSHEYSNADDMVQAASFALSLRESFDMAQTMPHPDIHKKTGPAI